MDDPMDLIEKVDIKVEGKGVHTNRWVPSVGKPKAIAVRHADGSLYVEVRGASVSHVKMTKAEMLAFGIACIQAAQEVK